MRRVMAVIGFSSFFVSLFCIFVGKSIALYLCVISAIIMIAFAAFRKTRISILILLFATVSLSALNCFVTDSKIQNYNEVYCSGETEISGVLLDYPYETESGFRYTFRTDDENKVKFSVMTSEPLDISPNDKIKGTFEFSDDYADKSEKIYFSTYIYNTYESADIEVTENNKDFCISNFRKTLKQGIVDNTTFGRGLTTAILFGDKSGLQDELYNDLLRCGLLHATATSGLHLTVVTGFLFAFLSFLGVSRKKSSLLAIGFIILFMIVIGFKFSLMRAGIMMIMYFAAGLFNRESDGFNAIGTAFAFLIFQNPYTVVSCSFLLSASATIGIIMLFSPMYSLVQKISFGKFEIVKRLVVSLMASVLQSISAILFTLPVTYIFFGYFSIAGIFANAVLSPFISVILISGVALCLIFFIPVVPQIIGGALDMVCLALIKISSVISGFKYCLISIDYNYIAWFFFACSAVISASVIIYYFVKSDKRKILRVSSLLCFDLLLLTVLLINIFPSFDAELKINNSNGGVCITAVSNGEMVVIDTGGKNAVKKVNYETVRKNSNEVALMISPVGDKNGFSSAMSLSKSFKIYNVLCDVKALENTPYNIDGKKIDINTVDNIAFGDLNIKIIHQQNNCALYLTNGKVSVLILNSDIDCAQLENDYKNCDLVVIDDKPPINIEQLSVKSAVVCSYNKEVIKSVAQKFDTYSLASESYRVFISDKIKIKKE